MYWVVVEVGMVYGRLFNIVDLGERDCVRVYGFKGNLGIKVLFGFWFYFLEEYCFVDSVFFCGCSRKCIVIFFMVLFF